MPFKSAVKQLCDVLRINEWLMRRQRTDLLVLCYHGVIARRRPDRWMYENWVDADSFRSQLRWLKGILEPIDTDGLRRWREGNWRSPKSPVMITFDDGYRNNVKQAEPILKEESVPALFFLTTGYVGTSRTIWNDEVRLRVAGCTAPELRLPSGDAITMPADTQGRRTLADRCNRQCKILNEECRQEFLEYLRSKTPAINAMDDAEARQFMNWDEARELSGMGFEVGAHTVEHVILSREDRPRVAAELRASKAAIEGELKRPCRTIAYPNGTAPDVNGMVFEQVRQAGYEWAFLTDPVWQKPGGDAYRIPRICVPGHADLAAFKFYSSGLQARLSGAA